MIKKIELTICQIVKLSSLRLQRSKRLDWQFDDMRMLSCTQTLRVLHPEISEGQNIGKNPIEVMELTLSSLRQWDWRGKHGRQHLPTKEPYIRPYTAVHIRLCTVIFVPSTVTVKSLEAPPVYAVVRIRRPAPTRGRWRNYRERRWESALEAACDLDRWPFGVWGGDPERPRYPDRYIWV